MSSGNPYGPPESGPPQFAPPPSHGPPPGERFAPCPQCGGGEAARVKFSSWGGVVGPKILSHVKCHRCGYKYNGKKGASNAGAIAIYTIVGGLIGIALALLIFYLLVWSK